MDTDSGKWVWWKKYIKLMKIYWGPSGEGPAITSKIYTESEWLLEEIKQPSRRSILPSKKSRIYY